MHSDNDLNEKLNRIVSELNEESSKMAADNIINYTLFSLRAISSYVKVLFDRLNKTQNAPIEQIAMSARNLFECYLLTAFIIADPARAKDFISQKAYDELEINEGFLSLTTTNTFAATIKMIQDRKDNINKLMKNFGLTPSKHWTVSKLAQQTNNKVEYDAFFKLYSKYVHPSSWIMNSYEHEYDNPVFRNIFLSQGQIFTNRIINLIYKFQGK